MHLITEKELHSAIDLEAPQDIRSLPKDIVINFDYPQLLIDSIKQTRGLAEIIGVSDLSLRLIDRANHEVSRPITMRDNRIYTLPFNSEGTEFIGHEITECGRIIISSNSELLNWGLPRKLAVYKGGLPIPTAETWVQTDEEGLEEILKALKVYGRTNKGGITIKYYPLDGIYTRVATFDAPIYYGERKDLLQIADRDVYTFQKKESFCLRGQPIALRISSSLQIDNFFDSLSPLKAEDNKERLSELKKLFYEGNTVGPITGAELYSFTMSFGAHTTELFKPKTINGKTVYPISLFSTSPSEHSAPQITRCDYLLGFNFTPNITMNTNSGPQRISNSMTNPISAKPSYSLSLVDTSDPKNQVTNDFSYTGNYIVRMNFNPFVN